MARTRNTQDVIELTPQDEIVPELPDDPAPATETVVETSQASKIVMEIMYPLVNPRFRVDIKALPEISTKSLCQQAVNHRMSNMVDATVNAWVRVEKLGYKSSNAKDASPSVKAEITAAITKWRKDHADDYEAKRLEEQTANWNEMLAGFELGSRGPRLDPVEKEYNALLMKQVRTRFAEVTEEGTEFPKDDTTPVTLINGTVITRSQMVAIIEDRHGAEFKTRAEAIVAAREGKATAAPASAEAF